jgi:hypothetical protein
MIDKPNNAPRASLIIVQEGDPIVNMTNNVNRIKDSVMKTCVNPLPVIVTAGLLEKT